ncbi:MAG: exodeoxyribonuclease VII small subunit [Ornithinimicrobium sp.]
MADDTTPGLNGDNEDHAGAEAQTDTRDLTYEQAREELITIVARIESGEVPLEESMRLWERGEALAAHCQAKLDTAQEQLDKTVAEEPTPTD